MTHKTFRELQSYELEKRKKVREMADDLLQQLTGEEAYLLINHISYALFLSCQTVEEKQIINQTTETDVEELV